MSTSVPLVSIVIPCFNYAQFLGHAIESALQQTYPRVEVIVVDDGSADETSRVASRYPIRLIRQVNAGSAAATNAGVRGACGEFVVRLDADDVLYPRFVEATVAARLYAYDADLIFTRAEYFGSRSGLVAFEPFDAERLAEGAYATCCALISREAWDVVGGLDEQLTLLEDWDLWLAFAERGMSGMLLPQTLWAYRQHRGSQIHRRMWSLQGLRREYALISRLQDKHPRLFRPSALLRRLSTAPIRTLSGALSPRSFLLLVGFYGVMLVRALFHQDRVPTVLGRPGVGSS